MTDARTRYAANTDTNQTALVKLMRKIGMTVEISKVPLDLQIARHFITVQADVKNPEWSPSGRRLNPKQKKFYDRKHHAFLICVLETDQDVMDLNAAMTAGLKSTHAYCVENMANHFATKYTRRGER